MEEIPMSAILENQAFDAHQEYLKISRSLQEPSFDPKTAPPAWKCILDELVYTVAADPNFTGGNWPIRDVLLKLVQEGLKVADAEIAREKKP